MGDLNMNYIKNSELLNKIKGDLKKEKKLNKNSIVQPIEKEVIIPII